MNIKWPRWLISPKVDKTEILLIFIPDNLEIVNKSMNKSIIIKFGMYKCILFNKKCKI